MNTPWHDDDISKMTLTDGGVLVKSKGGENELAMGEKVEAEHDDIYADLEKWAQEQGVKLPIGKKEFHKRIAQAHLKEMKDYYTRLKKMEGK